MTMVLAGRDARWAGRPVSDCPYRRASEERGDRFAAYWWLKGWRHASLVKESS